MSGTSFWEQILFFNRTVVSPERIFANAIILAAGRDDVPAEQMRKHKEYLCQKYQRVYN